MYYVIVLQPYIKWTADFRNCVLKRDGQEFSLELGFEEDAGKTAIEKMIEDLISEYLKLPEKEKLIRSYAAENTAEGKYSDIKSITGWLYEIRLLRNGEDDYFEYYFINNDSIYGCDFIVVRVGLNGLAYAVCLVG